MMITAPLPTSLPVPAVVGIAITGASFAVMRATPPLIAMKLSSGPSCVASTETPWVAGDFIFVLTTRGEVVCLRRDDGRIRWVSPLPRLINPDDAGSTTIVWSGPILVGDRLIVAGSHGEAITMSPYTGEILGRQKLPGPVVIPPVAAEGTVYILTENAQLLAYR